MTEERKKILLSLRDDLIKFGRTIAPKFFSVRSPEFHYEISENLLDDTIKFLNIIAPRGTAKSTLVGVFKVLHHLMFTSNKKVIAIVSRTQGHAINLLQTIKDIIEYSPEFRELFGYWGINVSKKWTSSEIILKDGSAIICKGMGQMLRGLNIGGQRPTLIILDDPEDENNTKTSEAMNSNFTWLLQSAEPALDARRGRIIIIGTPLHQNCVVMKLSDSTKYTTLHYKYLHEEDNNIKWSLWPEMYSVEDLEQMRNDADEMGKISSFYKERQCEITGEEDQLFKKEYMKFWDGYCETRKENNKWLSFLHVTDIRESFSSNWTKLEEELVFPVNNFIGIDPASSQMQTADWTVVYPVSYSKKEELWTLPYWRKRAAPHEVADGIINKLKETRPERGGIETTNYQEMLREEVRRRMLKEDCHTSGFEQEDGFRPRTEKNKRLERLQPYFYRRQVWIHRSNQAFIDELLMYPRGKHDDTLDAFDYATKRLYPPNHEVTIKKTENKPWRKSEQEWFAYALG
jgi:predicted phage terminase large subunit-like protein